jgi:hypothetical protein
MIKPKSIASDIKKLRQNKQFLTIMVLLFVALLFWITISLITSQKTEKISPELKVLSSPLTPVIDESIFDNISAKKEYSEDELSAFTIFKVLTSRDGKTQRVVPIEITIDDLEPKDTPKPESSDSLLQEEIQIDSQTTEPLTQTDPLLEPTLLGSPDLL